MKKPATNPMTHAKNVASMSSATAEELGKISAAFRKAAPMFANVGDKEEARKLRGYATGFNRAAGVRGKSDRDE